MRELETSLQQFGEFLLKAQLVQEKAAPYCVRWVRGFLTRPASNEPLPDQVRRFCEELELGHANVETTMVYTHVVKELRNPARSPLDILRARAAKPGTKKSP